MRFKVGIKRVEPGSEYDLVFVLVDFWVFVWRLLKYFLVVLTCFDGIFLLHVQVAQTEVHIGKKELFLYQLICLIEVLLRKLKPILLDTEVA